MVEQLAVYDLERDGYDLLGMIWCKKTKSQRKVRYTGVFKKLGKPEGDDKVSLEYEEALWDDTREKCEDYSGGVHDLTSRDAL